MRLSKKMVDALCRKWNYPVQVKGKKEIRVPDPDPDAEMGDTVTKVIDAMVENPQTRDEFVQEYIDSFVVNEYRLQHRQDRKNASDKEADKDVEEEVKKIKAQ